MPKRREDIPLSKHTLNLYQGDYDRLMDLYPRWGAGKVIRDLVRRHLRFLDEEMNRRPKPAVADIGIDLEELFEQDTTIKAEPL